MAANKVLVVYYSRSGNTRRLGDEIARAFANCDVEVIRDTAARRGVGGYLRSAYQALRRQTTRLEPSRFDPRKYDLVIVGTPVWASSLSVPVRSYLGEHGRELTRVAFFLTHGGSGKNRVFAQMTHLTAKPPVATLAVREVELRRDSFLVRVRDFVERCARELPRGEVAVASHDVAA